MVAGYQHFETIITIYTGMKKPMVVSNRRICTGEPIYDSGDLARLARYFNMTFGFSGGYPSSHSEALPKTNQSHPGDVLRFILQLR